MRIGIVDVRSASDRDKQILAVCGEDNIPRPMAPATQLCITRYIGDDGLRYASSFQIPRRVGEANNGGGVSDVNPMRMGAGGIKRNAKWGSRPFA